MSARPARHPLGREELAWLTAAVALVVLPHVLRLPPWVSGLFAALVLWQVAVLTRRLAAPGALLRLALQGALLAGVYLEYGSLFGRNPGVALLVGLTGLKLLETRSRRDGVVTVLLAYFLVITNFLYSQSIPTGAYMFVVVVVTTAALIRLHAPAAQLGWRPTVRLAGSLLVQALPLMLVLFVLFPRIPGPLWGLPDDARNGITGLSDTMSPGQISNLGQSNAIAFRVRTEGAPPPAEARYWRGPVLWDTDGRTWSAGRPLPGPAPTVRAAGETVDYEITLEPHDRRWLFLLDAPVALPEGATLSAGLVARAARPVRERQRYQARSAPAYALPGIDARSRRRALTLPVDAHPRARDLAGRWQREGARGRALVERALDHFATGNYVYTLRPPLLPGDPVDEFLFDARRGFCEHYAAAFVVLMRAGGVPARVVTGYQGGEINPVDGYLVVRQRDAHAWAEVWLEDAGWVRADPTAVVSPARVEQGLEQALPAPAAPVIGLSAENQARVRALLRELRFGWDAVNNWWNQWVLGYGQDRQRSLLARLGIDAADWRQMAALMGGLAAASVLPVAVWLARRTRAGLDPARRLYDRFCRRLARQGVARRDWEGPRDFAARAAAALPARAPEVRAVTRAYLDARYREDPAGLARLRQLVRASRR